MKVRINLRIGPGDSAALRRNVLAVWTGPREDPTRKAFGKTDLGDAMLEDLASEFAEEDALVERLLDERAFERGPVVLEVAEAEALLRASSAIRLALRCGPLAPVPDEALEAGEVGDWLKGREKSEAFACYLFFAAVQEHIIYGLDPTVHDGLLDIPFAEEDDFDDSMEDPEGGADGSQ